MFFRDKKMKKYLEWREKIEKLDSEVKHGGANFMDEVNEKFYINVRCENGEYILKVFDMKEMTLCDEISLKYPNVIFRTTDELLKKGIMVIRNYKEVLKGIVSEECLYDSSNGKMLVESGLFDTFAFKSDEVSPVKEKDAVDIM